MAEISLKIKSDSEQAVADLKKFRGEVTLTDKEIAKIQKDLADPRIDKFMSSARLAGNAMTAAKGSSAGLSVELRKLQNEMARLIRNGVGPLDPALDKFKIRMTEIEKQMPKASGNFGALGNAAMIAGAAIASSMVVNKLIDIGKATLTAAAGMEQSRVAFTTMLGSAEKANTLLTQMQEFAASTPFQFNEVVDAGKRMIAFGFASEEVVDKLGMVGDVAAGLSQPIGDMVYLFGQIKTQGKAMTQDLNQFANRGVPIFEEVAKAMGVPTKEVKKLAEQGKITYDVINKAFENMTGSGGKFGGLMQAQSKTLSGQWSNFNDQLDKTKVILGEGLMGGAKKDLSVMSALLSKYTEIAQENQKREASEARYITLQGKTAEMILGTKEKLEMIAELDRDKRGAALVYQGYLKGDVALNQKQIAQLEQRLGLQRSLSDIAYQANKNELESWKQRGLIVGAVEKKAAVKSTSGVSGGTKKSEAQIMQEDLASMANIQAQGYADQLLAAESFFVKKAELEKIHTEDLTAWQAEQTALIANNNKLDYDQKIIAMQAMSVASKKIADNDLKNFTKHGQMVVGTSIDMFTDLQTAMSNAGKNSKALAMTIKVLSAAQAGINSYLAFTQVLADQTIWPTWARIPIAGVVMAAGLAKQAAIWSTPISAETGIQNYTVPETRGNRNDGAAVMAQGGEQVTVTPRGEESSQVTSVNISIGESQLFTIIQRGINTGQINVSNKNVGSAVFAR